MTHHSVTILQKNYNIFCSEAEIPRLEECTKAVNEILGKIFNSSKAHAETTVMAMALLTMMDELLDYKNNAQNPKMTISDQEIPQDMIIRLESISQKLNSVDIKTT